MPLKMHVPKKIKKCSLFSHTTNSMPIQGIKYQIQIINFDIIFSGGKKKIENRINYAVSYWKALFCTTKLFKSPATSMAASQLAFPRLFKHILVFEPVGQTLIKRFSSIFFCDIAHKKAIFINIITPYQNFFQLSVFCNSKFKNN